MNTNLKIHNLNKKFDDLIVFDNLSMEIPKNKISCVLGPSGCGKTTMLNLISGIQEPQSGQLDDFKTLTFSFIFQDARLLPWKSIQNNLDFVLKSKYSVEERKDIINKYLDIVELLDFKDYYPHRLSGGMKQRAAIARAFAFPADVLIMDEPFKGLDIKTKKTIIDKFIQLWNQDKRTVIFVTHDLEECLQVADKIFVFSKLPTKVIYEDIIKIPQDKRKLNDVKLNDIEEKVKRIFFE